MVLEARRGIRGACTAPHSSPLLNMRLDVTPHLPLSCALQMNSYANACQQRSFNEQLGQGVHACHMPYAYSVALKTFKAYAYRCAGIKQPVVEGITPERVQTKIRYEQEKNAIRLQPAFPAAVQDDGPNDLSPLPCAVSRKIRSTRTLHTLAFNSQLSHSAIFP